MLQPEITIVAWMKCKGSSRARFGCCRLRRWTRVGKANTWSQHQWQTDRHIIWPQAACKTNLFACLWDRYLVGRFVLSISVCCSAPRLSTACVLWNAGLSLLSNVVAKCLENSSLCCKECPGLLGLIDWLYVTVQCFVESTVTCKYVYISISLASEFFIYYCIYTLNFVCVNRMSKREGIFRSSSRRRLDGGDLWMERAVCWTLTHRRHLIMREQGSHSKTLLAALTSTTNHYVWSSSSSILLHPLLHSTATDRAS